MKLKKLQAHFYMFTHKQPDRTEDMICISDIIVPNVFKKCPPNLWKIERANRLYKQFGYIDKPLIVKKTIHRQTGKITYILKNEYTRYLTLLENNMMFAPVVLKK